MHFILVLFSSRRTLFRFFYTLFSLVYTVENIQDLSLHIPYLYATARVHILRRVQATFKTSAPPSRLLNSLRNAYRV